jgi:hypothetical protein
MTRRIGAGPVDPGGLRICADCRRLKGAVPGPDPRTQRCGCQGRAPEGPRQTWPGYDHNTYAELCRCCALVLLPSGLKWSVWFCDDCKPLVIAFNRAVGRYVIPIGRHSIMNRVGIRADALVSTPTIDRFVDDVRSMAGGIERLAAFAMQVTEQNLTTLGFDVTRDTPLAAYLRAIERSELTHHAAFVALVLTAMGGTARSAEVRR